PDKRFPLLLVMRGVLEKLSELITNTWRISAGWFSRNVGSPIFNGTTVPYSAAHWDKNPSLSLRKWDRWPTKGYPGGPVARFDALLCPTSIAQTLRDAL